MLVRGAPLDRRTHPLVGEINEREGKQREALAPAAGKALA